MSAAMSRRKHGMPGGMLGGRRCSSLATTALVCVVLMGSTRLLLRGQVTHGDADYLYKVEGAQPIIEEEAGSAHNLQFQRSPNQRVVEFYDPACGACQSFRWNYIEIAKKVRSTKPDVEFYAVSCAVHPNVCKEYGRTTVPKIFAFPTGGSEEGMKQVEKGAGTIYFLSARILKALRSEEEIQKDIDESKGDFDIVQTPNAVGWRRLDEKVEISEDEMHDSDDNEDEERPIEDGDSLASLDKDEDKTMDRTVIEESMAEFEEDTRGDDQHSLVADGGEQARTLPEREEEQLKLPVDTRAAEGDVPSQDDETGRGEDERSDRFRLRYDNGDPAGEDGPMRMSRHSQYLKEKELQAIIENAQKQLNELSKERAVPATKQPGKAKDILLIPSTALGRPHPSSNQKRSEVANEFSAAQNKFPKSKLHSGHELFEKRSPLEETKPWLKPDQKWKYEYSDAHKNTLKAFVDKDREAGVQDGYHFAKWQEQRSMAVGGKQLEDKTTAFATKDEKQKEISYVDAYKGAGDGDSKKIAQPPNTDTIPIRGKYDLPVAFREDPMKAQKFRNYVAKKRDKLQRIEKIKHPLGIRAEADPSVHVKSSQMVKSEIPDLRPDSQHKKVGEKVFKKIPIINRAYKRTKAFETLNDAALSFTRGLMMGVFKTNKPLDYKRKAALIDWIDLLRVSLPPEIGLHELLDTLKYDMDFISQSPQNLKSILESHPIPDGQWSRSCTRGLKGTGFFCGFWKLLHVMSLGFAEQTGGLALKDTYPNTRVFSAKEAAGVFREYMALFFNCEKCSRRFLALFDDCSFQRCARLSSSVNAPAESWREFPLWMWQVHNDVSRSKSERAAVSHEREGKKELARKFKKDMKAIYPTLDNCIRCVTSDGNWQLNAVYDYLNNEYWTFGQQNINPRQEKLLQNQVIERQRVSYGLVTYLLVSIVLIGTWLAKKHHVRWLGNHRLPTILYRKKESFSKKYRDS